MNIISFSLYGDKPLYVDGMRENIELAQTFYPDWRVRIYTDRPTICDKSWVDIVQMHSGPSWRSTHEPLFWRFLAADDADVAIFRDADSRLNRREAAAVGEWLSSDKQFHVMRDHPDHANWPMLGGMWGCRRGAVEYMAERIARWPTKGKMLDDMAFLAREIWPMARESMVHHSSVNTTHPDPRPFPTELPSGFVGEIVHI